jgi:hypothetical protein
MQLCAVRTAKKRRVGCYPSLTLPLLRTASLQKRAMPKLTGELKATNHFEQTVSVGFILMSATESLSTCLPVLSCAVCSQLQALLLLVTLLVSSSRLPSLIRRIAEIINTTYSNSSPRDAE